MTILSKYVCEADCKVFVHAFEPACLKASYIALKITLKNSLGIYGFLYLISALLRGRSFKYYYTRLPHETLQSSIFLAVNCVAFLGSFCLSRQLFGNVSYWRTLLANIPACLISILIERKQRRGLLALYLTNLATETAFNMMAYRKWITKVNNGEVLIFAIASAIYSLLFKMKTLDTSIHKLLRNFIGSSEEIESDHQAKLNRKSRLVVYLGFMTEIASRITARFNSLFSLSSASNPGIYLMKSYEAFFDKFLTKLSKSTKCKSHLCNHRYNCLIYPIIGFVQRFLVGYVLQAIFKVFGSLTKILKKPKLLFKILGNPVNKQLGLFLGSYIFIYRISSCLYRWLTNSDDKLNGLISGFFAGWSMMFYKSSSIALYLNFKLLEILWMLGVKNKQLPLYKSFDVILYSLSTAFVLWVAIFEPHNIRHSYWKFMVNISDNRLKEVDRYVLDAFGTNASLIDRLGKA